MRMNMVSVLSLELAHSESDLHGSRTDELKHNDRSERIDRPAAGCARVGRTCKSWLAPSKDERNATCSASRLAATEYSPHECHRPVLLSAAFPLQCWPTSRYWPATKTMLSEGYLNLGLQQSAVGICSSAWQWLAKLWLASKSSSRLCFILGKNKMSHTCTVQRQMHRSNTSPISARPADCGAPAIRMLSVRHSPIKRLRGME